MTSEALDSLEKAVQNHDVRLTLMKVDPRWNNLGQIRGLPSL